MLALAMALLSAPIAAAHRRALAGARPRWWSNGSSTRCGRSGQAGTSVLLVEQSVNVAVAVADRVVVMDSGAMRFSGTAAEVRDHPELLWSIFLRRAASRVGAGTGRRVRADAGPRAGTVGPAAGQPGGAGGQRGHRDLRRDHRPRVR